MENNPIDIENTKILASKAENINIHEQLRSEGQVYNVQVLALKLRYWIDFRNQSHYNVDWLKTIGR
jgi:hypothetical protein